MSLDTLRERVRIGVEERLPVASFERYKRLHMKKCWRECDCSYCAEKRLNHSYLQFAPFHLNHQAKQVWRNGRILHTRQALAFEAEKVISNE